MRIFKSFFMFIAKSMFFASGFAYSVGEVFESIAYGPKIVPAPPKQKPVVKEDKKELNTFTTDDVDSIVSMLENKELYREVIIGLAKKQHSAKSINSDNTVSSFKGEVKIFKEPAFQKLMGADSIPDFLKKQDVDPVK